MKTDAAFDKLLNALIAVPKDEVAAIEHSEKKKKVAAIKKKEPKKPRRG